MCLPKSPFCWSSLPLLCGLLSPLYWFENIQGATWNLPPSLSSSIACSIPNSGVIWWDLILWAMLTAYLLPISHLIKPSLMGRSNSLPFSLQRHSIYSMLFSSLNYWTSASRLKLYEICYSEYTVSLFWPCIWTHFVNVTYVLMRMNLKVN